MENIFCVDSLEIFKDIHDSAAECSVEPVNSTPDEVLAVEKTESSDLAVLLSSDIQARQRLNERTPSARKVKVEESKIRLQEISNASGVRVGSKSKRALFPADDKCVGASSSKKRVSFKLVDIYARLHGAAPAVAHNAEEDAINLMKCFLAVKEQFIERAETTAKELMAIKPLGRKWNGIFIWNVAKFYWRQLLWGWHFNLYLYLSQTLHDCGNYLYCIIYSNLHANQASWIYIFYLLNKNRNFNELIRRLVSSIWIFPNERGARSIQWPASKWPEACPTTRPTSLVWCPLNWPLWNCLPIHCTSVSSCTCGNSHDLEAHARAYETFCNGNYDSRSPAMRSL